MPRALTAADRLPEPGDVLEWRGVGERETIRCTEQYRIGNGALRWKHETGEAGNYAACVYVSRRDGGPTTTDE